MFPKMFPEEPEEPEEELAQLGASDGRAVERLVFSGDVFLFVAASTAYHLPSSSTFQRDKKNNQRSINTSPSLVSIGILFFE